MSYIMRFEALAGIANPFAKDVIGAYLRSYDPDPRRPDGCVIKTTRRPLLAKRFETKEEAIKLWRTQSPPPHDLRPDGEPNRPLTAFTVSIVLLEEA